VECGLCGQVSETAEDAAVIRAPWAAAPLADAPVAYVVRAHGAVGAAREAGVHFCYAEHRLQGDAGVLYHHLTGSPEERRLLPAVALRQGACGLSALQIALDDREHLGDAEGLGDVAVDADIGGARHV
jgi:hypothetical protein